MPKRAPDHKAVVDTLVDEELDLRQLVELAKKQGDKTSEVIFRAVEKGLMNASHPTLKQALHQVFREAVLGSFVSLMHKAQAQTEQNLHQQIAAIEKFGKPITEIEAVVDEDVKQRISEKEGVK